jgi:hypothetical protein
MDRKNYTKPYMKVVNIRTCGMLAASEKTYNMNWSGNRHGDPAPGEIDEYSTYDSF